MEGGGGWWEHECWLAVWRQGGGTGGKGESGEGERRGEQQLCHEEVTGGASRRRVARWENSVNRGEGDGGWERRASRWEKQEGELWGRKRRVVRIWDESET